MTIVAIVILTLLLPVVVFDLALRPTIRRLALRNVVRRPGEAMLVVGGAMLATALITASFIIGDSFGSSIRNIAVDRYGPIDELVFVPDPGDLSEVVGAAEALPVDLVDGVVSASLTDVAVGSVGLDRKVEPELRLLEIDADAAIEFTGDPDLAGPTPPLGPGEVVLNQRTADALEVGVGDAVEVFVAGEPIGLSVKAIRPAEGLNGLGELIVAPGTITDRLDDPAAMATWAVFVSNTGDTFTGAELTGEVESELAARLGPDYAIEPVKQDLLLDAEAEAAEMTELFGTIGGFSVAAGILLVVNLFVMLASERKTEMGTLRATGLRRGSLVRAYSMEGAVYGLAASLAGTALGIGVAAVVMAMAGNLFEGDFTIGLAVEPTSLLSGAVIGLAVSQLTVVLTSWRVTRVNIVRALRDLPDPPTAGHDRRNLVFGVLGVMSGVGLYVLAGTTPVVAMIAPVLALVSSIPLLGRVTGTRIAVVGACSAGLFWVAAVFGLLPEVMDDPEVFMFLLQGVLLVALATVIVAVGDRVWLGLARALTGGGIASRIGLAEPLARPVRSALLVAMYSLVIFTITFMAVMNVVFQAQAPDFAVQAGGDYDVYVDANTTSGLSAEDLASRADVAAVAPVYRGFVAGSRPDPGSNEWTWAVSGIDDSFLAVEPPELQARSSEFASDDAVWRAVADGGSYVIVDDDVGLEPGDRYGFRGDDGSTVELTVAATTAQGWLINAGAIVGADVAIDLLADGRPPTRHYLALAEGADVEAVAAELTDGGLERGVDARTFLGAAKAATDEQQGFLNLLRGYLGLGLLIGIAGLGVVLVRAVRERRRQFGVMRALGIRASVVGQAFVIEAAFVAFQGVILGVGLGLLSSWQVLTRSDAFEANLTFTVPTAELVVLGLGCIVASLAIAAVPAVRASRTLPAVALRVT